VLAVGLEGVRLEISTLVTQNRRERLFDERVSELRQKEAPARPDARAADRGRQGGRRRSRSRSRDRDSSKKQRRSRSRSREPQPPAAALSRIAVQELLLPLDTKLCRGSVGDRSRRR
jgi:hypothetical protein